MVAKVHTVSLELCFWLFPANALCKSQRQLNFQERFHNACPQQSNILMRTTELFHPVALCSWRV